MPTLEKRLTVLEGKHASVELNDMTAEELDAHLDTLKPGSPQWLLVMLAGISRRGSRLPISAVQRHRQPLQDST
jgi:hypothetical protein